MTIMRKQLFLAGAALLVGAAASPAQLTVLHSFDGSRNDGASPNGSLALAGSALYGMTPYGGNTNFGTVFRINTDGTGYTILYHCRETAADGSEPWGTPLVDGLTLYGMTSLGGPVVTNDMTITTNETTLAVTTNWTTSINGAVFKISATGGVFTALHNFTGQDFYGISDDGSQPWGDVTLGGSALYGCTRSGGSNDLGTIFKVDTNGSGYAVLHHFTGGLTNGAIPCGALTLLDGVLYGVTSFGGSNNYGTVFTMNTNGTGFAILRHFRGAPWDGAQPWGSLVAAGGQLYGMTTFGGTNGFGTVYRIGTDGTGYAALYNFAGTANDGANPYGALALSGGTLYGMTAYGGSSNAGTLFQISTNGSGLRINHSFSGGTNDGARPYGAPTIVSNTLFGMTSLGGAANEGIIFASPLSADDSDGDGLPDEWETLYFGGATNANPAAPAANGVNTVMETYVAGLNPTNPASIFLISDFRSLISGNILQWSAVSGRVYSVYWTTNLFNSFQPLDSNIIWPQNSWTDAVHGAENQGFYRIKIQLAP